MEDWDIERVIRDFADAAERMKEGGMDGIEICRRIRQESGVPIVMLTARTDEVDFVVGLDAGADDYVGKPFRLAELRTEVEALRSLTYRAVDEYVRGGDMTRAVGLHRGHVVERADEVDRQRRPRRMHRGRNTGAGHRPRCAAQGDESDHRDATMQGGRTHGPSLGHDA